MRAPTRPVHSRILKSNVSGSGINILRISFPPRIQLIHSSREPIRATKKRKRVVVVVVFTAEEASIVPRILSFSSEIPLLSRYYYLAITARKLSAIYVASLRDMPITHFIAVEIRAAGRSTNTEEVLILYPLAACRGIYQPFNP